MLYDFFSWLYSIDKSDILNIHKYWMVKNSTQNVSIY